jgi:DNA-binding PadR family transcriptional regulator
MDVTANVLLISRALLDVPDQRRYGYELMAMTRLRTASMYQTLHRMEDNGWLTSYWETGNPRDLGRKRRRYYELTESGERTAKAHLKHWLETLRGENAA